MKIATNRIVKMIHMASAISLVFLSFSVYTPTTAYAEESSDGFVVFQLQGASPMSASSELVSIANTSPRPMRLHGLCVYYSAATSDNWSSRFCFSDQNEYTQLWISSGGVAYVSTDIFLEENPQFIRDGRLSRSMALSGGAIKLEQNGKVYDLLGWGDSVTYETEATITPSEDQMLERKIVNERYIDTDNNHDDFLLIQQGIRAQSGVFEVDVPRDLCLNIEGIQQDIPNGFVQYQNECYEDFCPNIEGIQDTLQNFTVNDQGECQEIQKEDREIIITELLPNVAGVDTGNEFIELFNPHGDDIDLSGYTLYAGSSTYTLGETILLSQSYLALNDSMTGITLPNTNGVEVLLVAANGDEVSRSFVYSDARDGYAWVLMDGQWEYSNQPTPGERNKRSLVEDTSQRQQSNTLSECPEGKFRNPETNRCKNIESTTDLVPCDDDEYRNPITNRCNKIVSASSQLKECGPNQERNPETNRCRTITTNQSLGPCPEGKERNPETNRCRTIVSSASGDSSGSSLSSSLSATVNDVPAKKTTAINWMLIIAAIAGSLLYIVYEWRVEIKNTFASLHRYRYNKT